MNVNSVTLIGRATRDAELKLFGDDQKVAKFALATNGKKSKNAEFHNIVVFGKLAEICKEYVQKGRLLYLQGRLKTSRWEDDKKVLHTKTEVIAQEMLLLDKKQALARAEETS